MAATVIGKNKKEMSELTDHVHGKLMSKKTFFNQVGFRFMLSSLTVTIFWEFFSASVTLLVILRRKITTFSAFLLGLIIYEILGLFIHQMTSWSSFSRVTLSKPGIPVPSLLVRPAF